MEKDRKLKVGVTCGDPAGIGPETIYKLCMDSRMLQEAMLIFYCPMQSLNQVKKQFQLEEVVFHTIHQASQAQAGKANILNPKVQPQTRLGKPTKESAMAAYWALETSTEDLKKGHLNAVVTAPLSKAQIMLVNPEFVGHTEYYQKHFKDEGALMVLCSERLRVALVTNHVALSGLLDVLTKDAILNALKNLETALRKDFNIIKPRIAVLGLNPHAGESGNLGKEEMEIISPAISAAKNAGILAFGPYSADGFFGSGLCFQFDAVLAMYHDQGLTGFKALAQDEGVNYTAGLTVVRTSPGHGTAFDLASKGRANEAGLRNAIYFALDVVKNREEHLFRTQNPLPFNAKSKEAS
jgi:4-hydroxythreonine-4-phosphate dehydrogenase